MPVFESAIDTNSAEFKANREAMLSLVAEMRGLEAGIVKNSARSKTRFEQRGLRLGHGVWDLMFTKAVSPHFSPDGQNLA